MVNNVEEYFREDPEASYCNKDGKKYFQSVHRKSYTRYNKAKKEVEKKVIDKEEIIEYVNELLETIGITPVSKPIMNPSEVNYKSLKEEYELDDEGDIVWIKFTTDGFIGCVAVSNDINFQIPSAISDYDILEKKYNEYTKRYEDDWKYNSSGILVHKLNKKWDESFVLVFPLKKRKESGYSRHEIEMAIGNYLSKGKNVPIIDYYSHNIG